MLLLVFLREKDSPSIPTPIVDRSFKGKLFSIFSSNEDDMKTCFSFKTSVMPEELIQLGVPEENNYKFPRDRPILFNVTFNQVHEILFGKMNPTIYENWPNYYKKSITYGYKTHLTVTIIKSIIDYITKKSLLKINFLVEIGSFTGMSAILLANVMKENQIKPLILCIDTWLGDMNMWINKEVYEYLSPVNGRPQVYEQFMANVIGHNLTETILPFSTTSILGARFLHIFHFHPQIIFLDSAHEQGETLIELALFWPLIQPGGILFGDDWDWKTVRCDVKKFAFYQKVEIEIIEGNIWSIKKPLTQSNKS
jgi:hypothetical protein